VIVRDLNLYQLKRETFTLKGDIIIGVTPRGALLYLSCLFELQRERFTLYSTLYYIVVNAFKPKRTFEVSTS